MGPSMQSCCSFLSIEKSSSLNAGVWAVATSNFLSPSMSTTLPERSTQSYSRSRSEIIGGCPQSLPSGERNRTFPTKPPGAVAIERSYARVCLLHAHKGT
jgi:hypothetical protein